MMSRILVVLALISIATPACAKPPPKTIDALRGLDRNVKLVEVGPIEGGEGFSATLFSYRSADLKVHAMLATPDGPEPASGWPIVVANHGHHPDPPKYGITADGADHRPGDYYRRIPELFVKHGFMVVLPDYRGHNNSEGFEFTEGMLESAYYTEDVINLVNAIDQINGVDADRIFMWGHSMGGEVTLRALLATDRIRAASLWSSVGGDIWDQSYYYSRYSEPDAPDSSDIDKAVITRTRNQIAELDGEFDPDSVEPLKYLGELNTPLIIHHAIDDTGAAFKWSALLAKELYLREKSYEFWPVQGGDHLFAGDDLTDAVDRDVDFFVRHAN